MGQYYTIKWINNYVSMLDQRLLPHEVVYRSYSNYQEVASAINMMVIRGAPAIGVAAGYGLALTGINSMVASSDELVTQLETASKVLLEARPTAINLRWAVDRIMLKVRKYTSHSIHELREMILAEAQLIEREDVETNHTMAKNGYELLPDSAQIIHHCNTGALATVDYGTALGVIRYAHEHGKKLHVYVDETRPRLQGSRLTSWELKQLGIPHTVIIDGASGHFMRTKGVDLCLVGCDRIAANGDVANKIGTYNLALAAWVHDVPFYSVGPITTIDLSTPSGDQIPIEERPAMEITNIGDVQIAPNGVDVANPAFDVTPAKFIRAIITDRGVIKPPYMNNIAEVMKR